MTFDDFWAAFVDAFPPRHRAHPKAEGQRRLKQALKIKDEAFLLSAARQENQKCLDDGSHGSSFVPMIATWLHKQRYADYEIDSMVASGVGPNFGRADDMGKANRGGGTVEAGKPISHTILPPEAHDERWVRIRARIRSEMGPAAWKTWGSQFVFVGFSGHQPQYVFANRAAINWIWESGIAGRMSDLWGCEGINHAIIAEEIADNVIPFKEAL